MSLSPEIEEQVRAYLVKQGHRTLRLKLSVYELVMISGSLLVTSKGVAEHHPEESAQALTLYHKLALNVARVNWTLYQALLAAMAETLADIESQRRQKR